MERTDPPAVSSDIWLIDLARDVPSQLTSDPGNDLYPVWSPDGEPDRLRLYPGRPIKTLSEALKRCGGDEELLKSAEPLGIWDWSADGRFILYRTFI